MIFQFIHRSLPALLSTTLALAIASGAAAQQSPSRQPKPPATPAQQPAGQRSTTAKPAASTARPAPAAAAPAAAPSPAPGGVAATMVVSFGDWGVYTAQAGRSKICYALTQPKDRLPKELKRDPAYLFVSFRPAENVRNEVALVMGFAAKDDSPAEAAIGNATYALLTKEQNAWLKNPAEEGQAITTMSRGQNLVVKARSKRGNQLTDRYSLNGFGAAVERARKECS